MKRRFVTTSIFTGWLAGASLFLPGCENKNQRELQQIQAAKTLSQERKDTIREAFRYLPQLIRLDRIAALKEIRYQLNTWSKSVQNPPEWKSPELLNSIAPSLLTIDFSKRMKEIEFGEPECEYLLQCQMLSQVAGWVLEQPYRDGLFLDWLAAQQKTLPPEEGLRLETALKLFDWTICNVAMEGAPKDVEQLLTNPDLPISDTAPIYRQLPWQTMMFARGDRWQRGRVFSQLLFSQGIDSVVLALPSPSGAVENASVRPWCIGVPIGEELYLFEPQWGMPIPSQSGDGIATLREAKSNPQVLRRAKIAGFFEYPVEQADLGKLIAMIDCEPFAVFRSMFTLQRSLTGDNRIRISMDADALEQRIQKLDETLSIRLWNVPWLSHVYNISLRQRLDEQSPFSMQYMDQYGVFIMDTPISRARQLHFNGQFESTVEADGALRTYMDFRVDEQTLKDLMTDRMIQQELGMVRSPYEPIERFEMRLLQAQGFFRRSKFDIGIFAAMANGDLNKPETAIDWLQKRTLDVEGTQKWHAHAHYLLGRMYERTGKPKQAEAEYKFEASPQAAGNRIRIRKLRQKFSTELGEE
jgi:hypothetical protein